MLIQIAIAACILSALLQDRTLIIGSLAGLSAALCVS